MPIGVQLRPCFGATAESLPALARSWRGGGGLLFPRVSSLLFSSLVFLKGALCSSRALLLRGKLPMQSSHAKALTPKLFRWAPPCIAIRCSERCTQKRLPSICWCLPPMHGPDRQMPCCPPAEAVRIFPRICALRKAAGLPARRATPMCIQGSIL